MRNGCDDSTKTTVVCKIHARNKQINLSCFGRLSLSYNVGESLINKPCGNLPSLDHLSNVIIYRIFLHPTLAWATVLALRM